MCGIFGYVGYKENAPDLVLAGLKELEYRGYDSWGVAAVPAVSSKFLPAQAGKVQSSKIQNTKIVVKKKTGKIGNATVDEIPESTFAFGHTRWA
ncbi:MAG: hypothetical protein Q7S76_00835, partial [bacterium]|nr:hypothetical protein [bacterium]